MADSINLVLLPGDKVPVINNPNTKDRAELAATVTVAHIAGRILVTAIANLFIKYQRISIKRASYVIYKQATKKEKREIKKPKSYVL